MAIKGFEILLWFLIIPLAAGNLPVFETGKEKDWFVRMADALICGYVLLFAVFELLALPLIFTRQSFAVLKYSYEILACVLALAGVIFAWKNKKNRADGAERKKSLSRKKIPAAMWLAFLLVAIQMGAYVFGMATDLDDAFYVATATDPGDERDVHVRCLYRNAGIVSSGEICVCTVSDPACILQ